MAFFDKLSGLFSPDLVQACLVLALISAAVVIGLFAYVGQRTERASYRYWTIGWLFYAVFLAAMIAADFMVQNWQLAAVPTACAALSALFIFAGNMEVVERPVGRNRIFILALVIVALNYLAHREGFAYWFSCPAFWALAAVAVHAGRLFYLSRTTTVGAKLVMTGYTVWAAMVVAVPLIERVPVLFGLNGFISAACLMAVALGVILDHQLTNSEQKYRALMEGSSDALFMVDLWSLKVVDANQAASRLARRSADELVGVDFPGMCPELRKAGKTMLDHRRMFADVFKPFNEFHLVRSDGSLVLCEGDTTLAQWQERAVVQVRLRELDPAKNLGPLVRRAEKMSSLGQLIAGVAHELNNPLAVVVGYAQILAKQPNESEFMRTYVGHILHEAERAAKIVRDLLSFARPCEPKFAVVEINQLVAAVLKVRQRDLAGHAIELREDLATGLSQTKADAIQIEQVLNNLITNAVHAMTSQAGARVLTVRTEAQGMFLRISVVDTGCGIAPETMAKMFEPFFTTKAPGKGTGLGLSISQNILAEHHGRLWAESTVGKGSTFHLELPVVPCEAPAPVPVATEPVATNVSVNQNRRLLVVDDEPGIRDVLTAILASCGYQVTGAANGVEALAEIRRQEFDLIITDMCMPEMDGEKLYDTIQAKHPKFADRMIFVTGDTVSVKSRTFLERTGCRWLSKPFNINDVEEAVETFLHERLDKLTDGTPFAVNQMKELLRHT
ncbi:MAG: Sensor histidine kinase RcsC [Verrucomicrobiae bacterium]|nr:Sensor histidine kinase RcsC [Verrucomicrobiae bacterium]